MLLRMIIDLTFHKSPQLKKDTIKSGIEHTEIKLEWSNPFIIWIKLYHLFPKHLPRVSCMRSISFQFVWPK